MSRALEKIIKKQEEAAGVILDESEWESVEQPQEKTEEKPKENVLNLNVLEKDLIASFLFDNKIWRSLYQHIEQSNFEYDNSKTTFEIFRNYFEKYRELPTHPQVISMSRNGDYGEVTPGFDSFIEYVFSKPFREDEAQFLYDSVHAFIKRNKMKNALIQSVTLIDDHTQYNDVEKMIQEVIMWNENIDMGFEIAKEIEERYVQIEKLKENGFISPWPSLNKIIGGQFYQQELTIFLSPTGVGKSLCLVNIACYARNILKKNILYVSLELSDLRLSQRFDAYVSGIEFLETPNNIPRIKDKWEKFNNGNLFIKEFPESKVTVDEIHEYIYKLEYFKGIKIQGIIVDHIDAMAPAYNRYGKNSNAYLDGGVITTELRSLAKTYKCPVLTATQANRGGYNIGVAEFTSEHVGDSMKKIHTADNMIALVANDENRRNNEAFMKTLKSRNGKPMQYFKLKTNYPQMRFSE